MVATGQKEHEQILPQARWVDDDAREIWQNVQEAIGLGGSPPWTLASVIVNG